ncbi:T9SS-dependent choice-of-anchor J family protein [Flavobacterium sp. JAS]|uniref:T9SS-dependent choice-of-anchor J family protein n=1 Tax=Flavobacterium sp. JAS TaxID=2897329 RepID=UPI001E60C4A8|nr:choice-of-anchor J domain-containing protein [Flavobacterium sp. JAS]MCD0472153.1 choice-of-anchor J domain-containing protein [Flavobacterium sp. JAS]
MKNIYAARHLMAFLSFFCFSVNLFAQTMPAPQALPYTQNFDGLTDKPTTYPDGFQGWTAAGSPGSTFKTNAALTDKTMTAIMSSSAPTAATGTGDIYNYTGKIGFLNTGTLDFTIGFAFNTTGYSAIQIKYDAMTIRNPYGLPGSPVSSRKNEMVLQYRVGTTNAFITLPETTYINNTVQQVTATTSPQNLITIRATLPSECDNQPIVQVRWISRQESGAGSRPSFAIDNIVIGSDNIAPVSQAGYPKADNITTASFDFSDKLNETGKTYYVLLPSGSTTPTIAQVKAGLDANDTAALQAGFLDVTDQSQVYVKSFTGLSINTAYSVFSVSEDSYGNIQTNVAKVDVTTANVVVPSLSTTVSSLDLGFSEASFNSDSFSYQIQASNLSDNVVATSSSTNFTLSKDNSTFGSSVTFTAVELAVNQIVYVHFTPNAVGNFSAEITHESTGATAKIVTLSGIGINPYVQGFNDAGVLTNSGWTQSNVAGTVNKWAYTTVARNVNSGTGAVLMNGFSESGASKDWLVSPRLRLNNFTQLPLLSFYSRKFYAGPELKLMVSVDYDGKGNPENATWTAINGSFPTTTGTYVQSQYIDLSAYKTDHTYVAWVYETTASGTNNAAEWSLDDIAITNETGYVVSNPVLDFGEVAQNSISTSQSFIFKAIGYNDITLTAPANYQISLDNSVFQSSVAVTEADALAGKTVYVRFTPTVKELSILGKIAVMGTSLNKEIGSLKGSSLLKADTFDVVTYNLEFFASDVKGSDGVEFGPTDDDVQIENVAKVMNKLNADVYVVQEVSNDAALDELITKLNINGKTFEKTISPSWSYSFDAPSPTFPPQKLVVLYNTQTATVKNTRVMFKDFYDKVRNGSVTLADYPDDQKSFFASGRLPYMVQIETNVGGVKKLINLVDIHARANSGSDMSKYNMRKYDIKVLADSLNTYYSKANLMILGDFNDDVKKSVVGTNNPSTYQVMVDDVTNFNALTLDISKAGAYSFLSSGGFLDHIIISNELTDQYIPNSTAVYDPRADITNYTNTTSDHGPVIARFALKADVLSTIDFEAKNGYVIKAYPNPATDQLNVVVKTEGNKNLKLRLYDLQGRLIGNSVDISGGQEKNTTVVPINNLQSGIYIYTLTENNKVIFSDKVIKK